MQGEAFTPITSRNFTGPCYEDPVPYVDYLVYDQVLDEWINVPIMVTGSYSMSVIIGDDGRRGGYLDLGSISVTSNGRVPQQSSLRRSHQAVDEDGDGDIDSINMSQEEAMGR